MSNDLVKRLRCYADIDDAVFHPWVYGEAADRIEKLEAALRRIKHMHEDGGVDDIVERDDRTYFIVCNALDAK